MTCLRLRSARQSQIRLAYEDRIATMRSDMDRLTSRHLLNREAMESELRRLVERQAVLDARQDVIAGLSQAARQAGIHPVTVTPATDRQDPAAPRRVRAETTLQHAPLRGRSAAGGNDQMARFQSLDAAADELLSRQMEYVNTIGRAVSDSSGTLSSVLSRLGVSQSQADARGSKGIGGPFVALPDRPGADQFMSAATAVADQVQRFSRTKSLNPRPPPCQTACTGARLQLLRTAPGPVPTAPRDALRHRFSKLTRGGLSKPRRPAWWCRQNIPVDTAKSSRSIMATASSLVSPISAA